MDSTLSSNETLGVFAAPFTAWPPDKLAFVLDRACEHRPWFPDHLWHDPEVRRRAANAHIADAATNGRVWEVWNGPQVVGIVALTQVAPKLDAQCHFLFFDHELRNKRQLCLNMMGSVFESYEFHALRVEVPECFAKYCGFLRKGLGFRYESERWLAPHEARKASRKYQAMLYDGEWQDVLLLSVTSQEFATFVGSQTRTAAQQPDRPLAGAPRSSRISAPAVLQQPSGVSRGVQR